jgi:hypothetical protein
MIYSSSRFNASTIAMEKYFPNFSISISKHSSGPEAGWKGSVQPIQTTSNLEELLDDIAMERPFYIQQGGAVFHHPDCKEIHQNYSWLNKIVDPHLAFDLEIKYWGGRKHPKAYVLSPTIPPYRRRHMYTDDSICAYAPWRNAWNWEHDTVADFMGLAIGWLIKWMIWNQTDTWIGEEVNHNPNYLLGIIGHDKQCWCGSGEKYKKCHQKLDEVQSRSLGRKLRR